MIPLHLMIFPHQEIQKLLDVEYHLLKNSDRNWCIITKSASPCIVMGVSAQENEVLNLPLIEKSSLPVIKRFSGGGTVVIDENTFFITFIFSKKQSMIFFPEEIYQWSAHILKPAFSLSGFDLKERDFVIHDKKVGGNAQYLTQNRWLQHTSFLWDFTPQNMDFLLMPKKIPPYRKNRSHKDFLTSLKHFYATKEELLSQIESSLHKFFIIKKTPLKDLSPVLFNL